MIDFAKLHALGNDFLVVPLPEQEGHQIAYASLTRSMCERRTGIGADGIVYYRPTVADADADFSVLIFNSDGSRAEMSGNGIRCLAAYLVCSGAVPAGVVRLRTVAGLRTLVLRDAAEPDYVFEAEMGVPITDPARIPAALGEPGVPVVDQRLHISGESFSVTLSSMGNPHCTTFWESVADVPVERYGTLLERSVPFPGGTNVEFVQVVDRHTLRVRFWERGAGLTLSSGTGSSAAAVAAVLSGRAESPIRVVTELGFLDVVWNPGQELRLTGPATVVCVGTYPNRGPSTIQ
jgi:diaminopimelate epimerase